MLKHKLNRRLFQINNDLTDNGVYKFYVKYQFKFQPSKLNMDVHVIWKWKKWSTVHCCMPQSSTGNSD